MSSDVRIECGENANFGLLAPATGLVGVLGWERFPWLHAAFSTRIGGGTSAYGWPDEQNLGWTAQDDPVVVAENRRRFVAAALGASLATAGYDAGDGSPLVTIRQIHGSIVCRVLADSGEVLATPDGRAVREGDGLMTQSVGVVLGVQTADCVPVLLADTRTRAVAALHAGWRGTLARIVEQGVGRMLAEFGSRPEDLVAAIGPAIRPCCFAIGEEVHTAFEGEFAYASELFSRGTDVHMDLHGANLRQLLAGGVRPEAITVIEECSACACVELGDGRVRRKYFSHRAERGNTGRMLSVIGTTAV